MGTTNLDSLRLANDLTVDDDVTISGDAAITGGLTVTGTLTATTAQGVANVNSAIKSKIFQVPISTGTVADGTTYTYLVAPGRAGTVTKISITASTKPAGGTNTVAIQKNGTTTLLNAATFDPTTITSNNVSQALTLTATTADLDLAATDVIKIVWTAGTQTTDAVAPVIAIEMNLTTNY